MWRFLAFIICTAPLFANAQIRFYSNFESGASVKVVSKLDSVTHKSIIISTTLDPKNQYNKQAHRSSRWFYFLMTGVKGDSIVMTINGSDPLRAMYSYDNIHFNRFTESEFNKSALNKRFDRDSIYISYFTPYTYSNLQNKIKEWRKSSFVKVDTIGYSAKRRPLQLLTITDHGVGDKDKRGVWVQARVHPSESPSSFVVDGVVERLIGQDEAELLKKTIFYILPMANPDGVAMGLSRSDTKGIDHEGNYDDKDARMAVEVAMVKKYISSLFENSHKIDLFLNIHAQVANKSSYWIHTAESSSEPLYNKKRLLSAHTELLPQKERGTDGFIERRDRVPEGWIFNNWGDSCLAVTLEVPYTYYSSTDMWVDESNLYLYGADVVDVVANAIGEPTSKNIIIDDTIKRRGWVEVYDVLCYGDKALQAKKKSAKAIFKTPKLSLGVWDIYKWSVENKAWEYFDELLVKSSESIPIGVKAKYKGEYLDALMLKKRLLL